MAGGGGGTLNKLFPGYKDKIWVRMPREWRLFLIRRAHKNFEKEWHAASVVANKRMQWYHKNVYEPLKPSYENRLPSVDYKRQRERGTLVEGRDMYIPDEKSQKRLYNFFEPYDNKEQENRQKHQYYDLKFGLLAFGAAWLIYDYMQSRPIVWCMEKEPPHPPHYPFWFKSILHSHDIPSCRRGYEVYRQVCATCHSMEQLHFRHLVNEILPEKRVKQIASSYDVEDGPNDQGDMYTRPGILTDAFPNPYPNEEAARYANAGAYPPDLSYISASRHRGPDYLMALLVGYRDPPEGVALRPGLYYNTWFAGGAIAMPPPLMDDMVEYEDGTPATVSQMSKDVINFLTWATEPIHDERKLMGLKALFGSIVGAALITVWHRTFFISYLTRRIDFGKIKHM